MAYIGTSPSNGVRRIHTYTATANQTTFTGSSTEGVTLTYADTNYIDVFQNGVLLGSADYTSTSGTSVVLAQGASADDLIVIVVYDVFSVADTVSKTNGGSFDSAVTMSNNLTVSGAFTSQGIDDNADATAITIDSSENVGVGGTPNNFGGMTTSLEIKGTSDVELSLHATSDAMSDGARIGQIVFNAGSDSTVPTVSAIKGSVSGTDENKGILSFHTRNTDTGGLPSERMRILSTGGVLMNRTSSNSSASTTLDIDAGSNIYCIVMTANPTNGAFVRFHKDDGSEIGSIDHTASVTRYLTSSDHRLKENVVAMEDATTRLKQLQPKRFNFIADSNDTTVDGFLAHEVQSVVPEAVSRTHNEVDDDGNPNYQGIDQSKLVPLLVKTIQELEARITALENAE